MATSDPTYACEIEKIEKKLEYVRTKASRRCESALSLERAPDILLPRVLPERNLGSVKQNSGSAPLSASGAEQ